MEVTRQNQWIVTSPLVRFHSELGAEFPSPNVDWTESALNPKNRVESTQDIAHDWVFFREHLPYTSISAVPKSSMGMPPRGVLIVIREAAYSRTTERSVKLLQRDISAAAHSPSVKSEFSQHILNGVQYWAARNEEAYCYGKVTFGSAILINKITPRYQNFDISWAFNQDLECSWKGVSHLQRSNVLSTVGGPQVVDIGALQLVRVIQPNTFLVSIKKHACNTTPTKNTLYIFKTAALAKDVPALYRELAYLVQLAPHRNVISAPPFIVTRHARFGGQTVRGFLLQFHTGGDLSAKLREANQLHRCPGSPVLPLELKLKWARQLVAAVSHVRQSVMGYYPDMKPENMVIDAEDNLVLIDMERKGTWVSWLPPELVFIKHLRALATVSDQRCSGIETDTSKYTHASRGMEKRSSLENARIQAQQLLDSLGGGNTDISDTNHDWSLLSDREKEAAMVFLVGKMLWCIFEEQPRMRAASFSCLDIFAESPPAKCYTECIKLHDDSKDDDKSCTYTGATEFGEFKFTPLPIRDIIMRCTLGAPEWNGVRRPVYTAGSFLKVRCNRAPSGIAIMPQSKLLGSCCSSDMQKSLDAVGELGLGVDRRHASCNLRSNETDYRACSDALDALCEFWGLNMQQARQYISAKVSGSLDTSAVALQALQRPNLGGVAKMLAAV